MQNRMSKSIHMVTEMLGSIIFGMSRMLPTEKAGKMYIFHKFFFARLGFF